MEDYSKYSFLTQNNNMRKLNEHFSETLINPELDINKLNEEFTNNRVVVINNFLKPEQVEILTQFLTYGMPSDWWNSASYPSQDKYDKVTYVRNFTENQEDISRNYAFATEAFARGEFAYHFFRTLDNHQEGCNCHECEFREWLISEEVINFISQITGEKYTTTDEVFAACYTPGDFLSPHVDSPNGTLGFVIQLSQNWLPQFGGLLHFMDDNKENVERIEVPEYNSLTLFYLPKGKGKWHYVSHVSPGVTELRLTYTGWYK